MEIEEDNPKIGEVEIDKKLLVKEKNKYEPEKGGVGEREDKEGVGVG